MPYINIWSRLHSSMAQNEANIEFYRALLFVKSQVKNAFRTKVIILCTGFIQASLCKIQELFKDV